MKIENIFGASNEGVSKAFDTQRLINLYPEIGQPSAKNSVALLGTPGTSLYHDFGSTSLIRGMHVFSDVLYTVVGSSLYSFDGTTWTVLGTLSTTSGPVQMANNGVKTGITDFNTATVGGGQLCIIDGVDGYIYDLEAGTLTDVSRNASGSIYSVLIDEPGYGYTSAPTVSFVSDAGSGASMYSRLVPVDVTVVNGVPGTGYAPGDVIAITGGAKITVTEVTLLSITMVNAQRGSLFKIGEYIAPTGGVARRNAIILVNNAGGGNGGIYNITLVDGGIYTGIPGTQSVNLKSLHDKGNGCLVDVTWGVVKGSAANGDRDYLTAPTNPVPQDQANSLTNGSGAAFNIQWGVDSPLIFNKDVNDTNHDGSTADDLVGKGYLFGTKYSRYTVDTAIRTNGVPGVGYAPDDLLRLTGGTFDRQTVLSVETVQAVSVSLVAGGSGYTSDDTLLFLDGGTYAGQFSVAAVISRGSVVSLGAIANVGSYSMTPALITTSPDVYATTLNKDNLTPAHGKGATLAITWGCGQVSIKQVGIYTVKPAPLTGLTVDAATSDTSGTGATFDITFPDDSLALKSWNGTTVTLTGGDGTALIEAKAAPPQLQVLNGGFPVDPKQLTQIDGYFVASNGTMAHWSSDLFDGTQWNPLATSPASSTPDRIQALADLHQQLIVIKEYNTEIWYDAAISTTIGSPFQKIGGSSMNVGTIAPSSVAQGADMLFWLATQRQGNSGELVGVVALSGNTPQLVSTTAINYRLGQLTSLADAEAYTYAENGHTFYVLTFPTDNVTFVFDATTQVWHERASYSASTLQGRHLGDGYAYFAGKHLVSDYAQSKLYTLSSSLRGDAVSGSSFLPIVRTAISGHIYDPEEFNRLFFASLQIDFATGNSFDIGGYNQESKALLSWSDDGGQTWSNEYEASLGFSGDYHRRVIWRRLGSSRDRVFKLVLSDPVKYIILGASAEVGV